MGVCRFDSCVEWFKAKPNRGHPLGGSNPPLSTPIAERVTAQRTQVRGINC